MIGPLFSFYNDFLNAYYDSGTEGTVVKQDRQGLCSHRAHIPEGKKANKTSEQLINHSGML